MIIKGTRLTPQLKQFLKPNNLYNLLVEFYDRLKSFLRRGNTLMPVKTTKDFGGELRLKLVAMPTRAYKLIGSYTGSISDLIELVSLARGEE